MNFNVWCFGLQEERRWWWPKKTIAIASGVQINKLKSRTPPTNKKKLDQLHTNPDINSKIKWLWSVTCAVVYDLSFFCEWDYGLYPGWKRAVSWKIRSFKVSLGKSSSSISNLNGASATGCQQLIKTVRTIPFHQQDVCTWSQFMDAPFAYFLKHFKMLTTHTIMAKAT